MADTFTTNYNFRKCEVGADNNTWGGFTNGNWDLLDTTLFNQLALKLSLSGGTMSGALNVFDVLPADNTNRKLGSNLKVFSDIFVQQIDFWTVAATPTLNGTLQSGGTGWTWKFPVVLQSMNWQDHSGNSLFSITEAGAITCGRAASPGSVSFTCYGAGFFSGAVLGQNFTATSDARLKTNVREIDDALSKILALRGVTFDWLEGLGERDGRSMGLIAQDVQKVFPEAVRPISEKYLGVDYNAIVGPLVEAVKILADRVYALESRAQR